MDDGKRGFAASVIVPIILVGILIVAAGIYYFFENAKPSGTSQNSPIATTSVSSANPSQAPTATVAVTSMTNATNSAVVQTNDGTSSMPDLPSNYVGIIQSSFQYPYPFSWTDTSADGGQFTYSITGVALGNVVFPPDSSYFAGGSLYGYLTTSTAVANARVMHALVIYVKIHRADNDYGPEDACAPLNVRRLTSEEGDFASPNTTQFVFPQQGGCSLAHGISVDNQPIIFAVSSTDQAFSFDTGNASSSFFNVGVSNGAITVSPEPGTD